MNASFPLKNGVKWRLPSFCSHGSSAGYFTPTVVRLGETSSIWTKVTSLKTFCYSFDNTSFVEIKCIVFAPKNWPYSCVFMFKTVSNHFILHLLFQKTGRRSSQRSVTSWSWLSLFRDSGQTYWNLLTLGGFLGKIRVSILHDDHRVKLHCKTGACKDTCDGCRYPVPQVKFPADAGKNLRRYQLPAVSAGNWRKFNCVRR